MTTTSPASMGGPLSEAEREHGIDIDWGYEAIRCKCDAAFVENDIEALSLHLQDVAREEATARVGVLEGQLATAQTEVVHMQAAATYREYAAAMNIDRVWDELPTYEQCAWRAVVRAVSTPLTNDITWLISEIGYDHWDSCQFDDDTDGDYCTLCDGYSDLRDKYETKRTRS